MPRRVLITGASGFIGGRLCEVMMQTGFFEPRALIHSTASAWRITRFPIEFVSGDLCKRDSIKRAVRDCDAVVHLARGDRAVMRKGLENILRAAVEQGVSRFIHMSSVAVYGNNPPPESFSEEAHARATNSTYGKEKLLQEQMVLKYHKKYQLPMVILRPPNVYGPYGAFTLNLINRLMSGTAAIVAGGKNPCNLVYIDNLIEAVLLALWKPEAAGQTFFITDREVFSWEKVMQDHASLLNAVVPYIESQDVVLSKKERLIVDSILELPRALLRSESRKSLAQVPAIKHLLDVLYGIFATLPDEAKQSIRLFVNGPTVFSQAGTRMPAFNQADSIIGAQFRTVTHSSEKAGRLIGYTAPVSYQEGMNLTKQWLRFAKFI